MSIDLEAIKRAREEADCLVGEREVEAALDRMAAEITARLADRNPLVYTVMNGGLIFAGRLLPRLPFALELAYLHATRYGHALKGALLPVVSYLGPATAQVITGSVVIETIFGIPGIGRYFVQGALNRDYTLVMGTVIVFAVVIILLNLIVDLLYGLLDPKVKQR